ncbi:MAG TPA: branched-chain amino acid ABC transporter permease [Terriglobales bacterium]|nr:branched-chain amino acid ABC transporter permease [Terriglobales bacterium]
MKELESTDLRSIPSVIDFKDPNFIVLLAALVPSVLVFFTGRPYLQFIMMYFFSYAIYTVSWDLLYSYSGQLSLGHALPFGLGAFFTMMLTQFVKIPLVPSAVIGVLGAAAVGGGIGATTIRLKPGYQGIAILLFSQVLYWLTLILYGEEGLSIFSSTPLSLETMYISGIIIFAAAMVAVFLIENSNYKLKLLAIKGDNLAANVCGINVPVHKAVVFFLSSLFAGIGGAYYGIFTSHTDFTVFAVPKSFLPIGMAIVGGVGSLGGPIIGSAIITILINILPIWYSLAVTYFTYGIVVIVILKIRPSGIVGLFQRRYQRGSQVAKG